MNVLCRFSPPPFYPCPRGPRKEGVNRIYQQLTTKSAFSVSDDMMYGWFKIERARNTHRRHTKTQNSGGWSQSRDNPIIIFYVDATRQYKKPTNELSTTYY